MKAIVFNNTTRFHFGCAAVMRVLHAELESAGINVLESVYGNTLWLNQTLPVFRQENWEDSDLIIVNGEGTMHDDSRMSLYLLESVLSKRGNKKAALINSLWCNMSPMLSDSLSGLDLVIFREPLSFASAKVKHAHIMPDLSYYEVPPFSQLRDQGFAKGTFYGSQFSESILDCSVDIMRDDWSVVVNTLRHSRACLTGKHHEVYAACIARCPFVTPKISTHKISALGSLIGEELPTLENDANQDQVQHALRLAEEDPNGLFKRLFDALENLRNRHCLQEYLGTLR